MAEARCAGSWAGGECGLCGGGAVLALVGAAATRGQEGSLLAQTSYKSLRQGFVFSYIANVRKWSELPE